MDRYPGRVRLRFAAVVFHQVSQVKWGKGLKGTEQKQRVSVAALLWL